MKLAVELDHKKVEAMMLPPVAEKKLQSWIRSRHLICSGNFTHESEMVISFLSVNKYMMLQISHSDMPSASGYTVIIQFQKM